MAKIVQSRFALLSVDDDCHSSDDQETKNKTSNEKTQSKSKKRNKKKKEGSDKELRSMAFGGSKGSKGKSSHTNGNHTSEANHGDKKNSEDWESWREMDEQVTQEDYQKQLQEAILQSKIDYEEHKEVMETLKEEKIQEKERKKKKKGKSTMSLAEFNSPAGGKTSRQNSESDSKMPMAEGDPAFFDKISSDASRIIQKEKIQEEYRKQYVVESAMTKKFEDIIEDKDKQILELTSTNQRLEEEIKSTKKRNKQLCHIMGQGEMKDKTAILTELEELRQMKEELNQEVVNLSAELEKERSKVHAIKAEYDKVKGGKKGTR